jgi:hypothetical protein
MNKRFNIIAACAILLAGIFIGGYFVLQAKSGSADFTETLTSLFKGTDEKNQDEKTRDQDNDGLTDWQEEIYKTDMLNPDTDNDGYLDGEEVLSGYDPTKPAPDDKLSDKAINPRPAKGSFVGVNLTEELGKSIVENIQANPSAALSDEATMDIQANDLVTNALAAALAKSPNLNLIPTISDNDIKISQETSKEAEDTYTKKMLEISVSAGAKYGLNKPVLEIAEKALETKSFFEFDKYINAYKEDYLAAKEIAAPIRWKEIHKKNLAFLIGEANILEALKLTDQDPLRAALAAQQYQSIIAGYKEMTNEASALITGSEIITP